MRTKIAYQSHNNGIFKGEVLSFENENGEYILPPNSTFEKPSGIIKEGMIEVLSGITWNYVECHIGKEVWDKITKQREKVDYPGHLRSNHTFKSIQNYDFVKFITWDEIKDSWELDNGKIEEVIDLIKFKIIQNTELKINNSFVEIGVNKLRCDYKSQMDFTTLYLTKDLRKYPLLFAIGNVNAMFNTIEDVLALYFAFTENIQSIMQKANIAINQLCNKTNSELQTIINNGEYNEAV